MKIILFIFIMIISLSISRFAEILFSKYKVLLMDYIKTSNYLYLVGQLVFSIMLFYQHFKISLKTENKD